MKKLFRTVMVLSVASLAVLSSCKKDDASVADATIDINAKIGTTAINDGATVTIGDVVKFTIVSTGNSDNKLKSITMTSTAGGAALLTEDLSGTSATNTAEFTAQTAGNVSFTVTLTSGKGNITKSFSIAVAAAVQVDTHNPTLGNQKDSAPKFWSAVNKTTYQLSDVKADPSLASKIDFGYCSRVAANLIISPASQDAEDIYSTQWSAADEKITTWNKRNATKFKATTLTQTQFEAATDATSIAALIASTKNTAGEPDLDKVPATNASVYLFKTEGGKYGLINVLSATGEVTGNPPAAIAGDVQLVVKYQK